MTTKLTPKQEKFCQEYLIDLNGTQAAIRAGYSLKTSGQIAEENLKKPEIQDRLRELRQPLQEATKLTQEWVLRRFEEISNRCMTAIPVMIRQGKDIVQKTDEEGNGVWEFDSAGANKATEMIGKHIGFFEVDNKQRVVQAPVINVLPPTNT